MSNYVNTGSDVLYSNSGDAIVKGEVVVVGRLLGVAQEDIAATSGTGRVAISGVHNIPAVTGAAFVQGQPIVWDVSADLADDAAATPATGDLSLGCIAMQTVTAAAGASVAVKLNVGPNTVA